MIPVLPFIIVASAIYRYSAKKGSAPTQAAAAQTGRQSRTFVYFLYVVIVLMPFVSLMIPLVVDSPVIGLATLFVGLPIVFPWGVSRKVLIPLGLVKPARLLTRIAGIEWWGDNVGGAVAAGAWAMLRRPRHDAKWADAQEVQLNGRPLRGGGMLAFGLLAASRGDLDGARTLLTSLDRLNGRAATPEARRLAREWIMVEATERGDWQAVYDAGARPGPRTAVSRLLSGVAARMLERPYAVAPLRLIVWWSLSFRWLASWPLLQQGLRGAAPMPPQAISAALDFNDSLALATTFHAEVLRTPPKDLNADRLIAAGLAWDAAFRDVTVVERLARRSVVLAQVPSDDITKKLRQTAVSDLVAATREAELRSQDWKDQGDILESVSSTVRHELLAEVEQAVRQLDQRVKAGRALPNIGEWREFLAIRSVYDRAAQFGGPDVRRLAFGDTYHPVSALSVWLYNKRNEKAIGHAIICWLLAEAKAVGDVDATALQTKNMLLGPGV